MKSDTFYSHLDKALPVLVLAILILYLPCWVVLFVLIPACMKIYAKLSAGICRSVRRLDGKTVIVTGANSGIGLETAKDFARRGAKVILACRSLERGKAALESIKAETGNTNLVLKQLDLSSFASVHKFCSEVKAEETRLDILVNNAGAATIEKIITADQLEMNFQANHFGPFLLTNLLLDLMQKTGNARIVMVASFMHTLVRKLDLDNLNSEKSWEPMMVYARTKLANILFAKELNRRLEAAGIDKITVNALHPGAVRTDLLNHSDDVWYFKLINPIQKYFFKDVVEGAQTTIHLAIAEELAGVSGQYFSDCKKARIISPLAKDANLGKQLWEKSVQATGIKPEDSILMS